MIRNTISIVWWNVSFMPSTNTICFTTLSLQIDMSPITKSQFKYSLKGDNSNIH